MRQYNIPRGIYGLALVTYIYKCNPNVIFVATKKTNYNIVIYEAIVRNGALYNIDIYWLEVDPGYRRGTSLRIDAVDLSIIERNVYGIDITTKKHNKLWDIRFKRYNRPLWLYINKNGSIGIFTYQRQTRSQSKYSDPGVLKLKYMHIYDNIIACIPTVSDIQVHSTTATGENVVESVYDT